MTAPFLLDTNAYFALFQNPKPPFYANLMTKVKDGPRVTFYISEITSMEIHSVVGKYRRGAPQQRQLCAREIIKDGKAETISVCSNTWLLRGRKRMKSRVFRDIQKMISDLERGRGDIQATVLELNHKAISEAQRLLSKYADQYNFGSHDALIIGSLIAAKQIQKINLTLVTSDKGVKAVLKQEAVACFDPRQS